MISETTVVALNMVLVGTVITFVPDRLVLIVDTGMEVVNVVVLVEFWAWTRSGNSPRITLSMCGCRAAIVENDDERRESRKGQWRSSRLEVLPSAIPEAVRDQVCTEQRTVITVIIPRAQRSAQTERSSFIKPQRSAHPVRKSTKRRSDGAWRERFQSSLASHHPHPFFSGKRSSNIPHRITWSPASKATQLAVHMSFCSQLSDYFM